eukprot:m.298021 g.298021  ORF g.298021 m.298021 type:complete len:192 (+) comp27213_c1_seq4:816-1391(+)
MGCTDTGGFGTESNRKNFYPWLRCTLPPGHFTKDYNLALPLYASTLNCSGGGGAPGGNGSCNGDIVQAPVNFSTLSDRYATFATEFIANVSVDPAPFLLYMPFSHIHTPQYVAPRNSGRSGKTGAAGHFYDTLLELDETVGAIMAALKASGVDDNTLVLVTGDNGPWEVKCALSGSSGHMAKARGRWRVLL